MYVCMLNSFSFAFRGAELPAVGRSEPRTAPSEVISGTPIAGFRAFGFGV